MPSVETLKEISPFLAVLVAFVAVFLGPILSAWIARRQIVAPIRQTWIDELRNLITDFLSTAQMIAVVNENGLLNENELDKETYKKMLSIERKLTLMLNPNEKLHNKLMDLIRDLLDKTEHGTSNLLEFGPLARKITETAQAILKEEWIRVKSGKI
ncbi:MAG: hypothetical protein HZB57_09715 [Gammaproteobacteria bacterium]|nr:hypothetical protein [Gammaproteobacteria bacterium]